MALIDDLRNQLGMTQPGPGMMSPDDMLALQMPQIGAGIGGGFGAAPEAPQLQLGGMGAGMPAGGDGGAAGLPGGSRGPQNGEQLQAWINLARELTEAQNQARGGGGGGAGGVQAPHGMRAQQTQVTQEVGGLPADERARGVATRGALDLQEQQAALQRKEEQARLAEEHAAKLRAEIDVENREQARRNEENEAKQTRIRHEEEQLAQQIDEPINPRRYFDNMSFFDKAAAIISAGIFGYLNPGSRDVAPIVGLVQQQAREDVQAQMANNQQNANRRNAMIAQYERQYGDTTLVQKRLEADRLLTLGKQAKAEGLDAGTQEARMQGEAMQAALNKQAGLLHQQIREAILTQPVRKETTTFEPIPPKGSGANITQATKIAMQMQEAGYNPDQIAAELQKRGLPVPGGKSEVERKRELDERKVAADEAKARALTPEQQKDLRDRTDGLAAMAQSMTELDAKLGFKRNLEGDVMEADEKKLDAAVRSSAGQVGQAAAHALPFGIDKGASEFMQKIAPEEVKQIDRIRDKIVFGQAKAEGAGALGDAERESYRSRLPTDNPLSIQRASSEMWRARRQQYENLKAQYGQELVDQMLRERGLQPADFGG